MRSAPERYSARTMATDPGLERYARQLVVPSIGEEGQRRLLAARAVVVGAGALGCVLASTLVRAGVGRVRVIDRDLVERTNLQRQELYDEADAAAALPKAVAAERRLRAANPDVHVEGVVADLTARNAERLLGDATAVLDGTDNFEARLLVNDVCVKRGIPWVYAGVISTYGHTMTVRPGETACFRCYVSEPPPAGAVETCETAGVIGPAVHVVAGLAAAEGLKLLAGRAGEVATGLLVLDAWARSFRRLEVRRDPECPACARARFDHLAGRAGADAAALCGQNAVQVRAPEDAPPADLGSVARRLEALVASGEVRDLRATEHLLRFGAADLEATVFPDGRAIVKGTADAGRARSFYARYIGA